MKHLFFIACFFQWLPVWAQPIESSTRLPEVITQVLQQQQIPSNAVSIVVRPLQEESAAAHIEHNSQAIFNPASVMKLLTSVAALELLGPQHTWKTGIYARNTPKYGRLNGDLYIKGSGDPKLTLEQFWLLLRDLRLQGVREIRGDLVLDRSIFAPIDEDPGAFDREPLKPQNVVPDGLLLNFNSIRLSFLLRPGSGKKILTIVPDINQPKLKIQNNLKLVPGECGNWRESITAQYLDHSSIPKIIFKGNYPESCGDKHWFFSLYSHDAYFAGVFKQVWQELGGHWIPSSSFNRRVREGTVPNDAVLLAEHQSPALADILRDMNKFSNNVMARQIFLTLAKIEQANFGQTDIRHDIPATSERAAQRVAQWLAHAGIKAPELVLENGSGLSRTERFSAAHIAAVLRYAWHRPFMPEFISSLSLFGLDGTTKRRYKDHPFAGQAHLKTGSLNEVRSLAGYVQAQSGQRYILVMIVNDLHADRAIPLQTALLDWVYQH